MMSAPDCDWTPAVILAWRSFLVDRLERDLEIHLLAILGELALELGFALGNEVDAIEQMQSRGLGCGRRDAHGGGGGRAFQKTSPGDCHEISSIHRVGATQGVDCGALPGHTAQPGDGGGGVVTDSLPDFRHHRQRYSPVTGQV